MQGHTASVLSVSFSPDGQYALTTGSDIRILLWYLDRAVMKDYLYNKQLLSAFTPTQIQEYQLDQYLELKVENWQLFLKESNFNDLRAFGMYYEAQGNQNNAPNIFNNYYQKANDCYQAARKLASTAPYLRDQANMTAAWAKKLLQYETEEAQATAKVQELLQLSTALLAETDLYNRNIRAWLEGLVKVGLDRAVVAEVLAQVE